jgi:sensor c-di-GMP phosphodiesterase-like protein
MRRKATIRVVLAVAIIGIALPVLAALYLAHRQSMDSEIELANAMTREILRRSDQAGTQAIEALQRIESASEPLSCSDRGLALMRDIDMESSYLQAVGLVSNGRLMCSSFGDHGDGIALGPVDYVSALGAEVRTSVALGPASEKRFIVLQKGTAAAAIHPEELIDTFVDRREIALGVYGASGGKRLSSRGFFDSRWITRLNGAASIVFFDGNYLVSMKRSTRFDTVAYVAVPVANLRARLMVFARVIVPIALILAAGLSFGIVKLARLRASLPAELRAALKRCEFELHYQPIVDLQTRCIVGIEALLRWPNRDGPLLRPDLFIPVAEECGLIEQFTRYVLERVANDAPRLLAICPDTYVSINLSSTDLHSEAIVASLQTLLQTPGIQPRNVLVEATEHSFLDPERALQVVARIRELGIRVAIDDFGTGYSSLSQLTRLPTDYLKIDKVFVDAIGTDSATSQVALHIIRIAESLGLKIIGEGVETEVQARFLGEHGVQFAQGWLFHEAMPIEQLLVVVSGHATLASPAS